MLEMNDKCLILCVADDKNWKEIRENKKLTCSKGGILRKAIVGRNVLFFNKSKHSFVGEAIISHKHNDVISFKDVLWNEYPTMAELKMRGVNFKFGSDREHKMLCSGKIFSKTDCEKISKFSTYLPDE